MAQPILTDLETRLNHCVVCQAEVDQPVDVLAALVAAADSIAAALNHADQLAPGEMWSPRAVAAHLADLEVFRGWRVRRILTEDEPLIESVDQDLWANVLRYQERDVQASLETFAANRRSILELLSVSGEAALFRPFRHPSLGRLSLLFLLEHTTPRPGSPQPDSWWLACLSPQARELLADDLPHNVRPRAADLRHRCRGLEAPRRHMGRRKLSGHPKPIS